MHLLANFPRRPDAELVPIKMTRMSGPNQGVAKPLNALFHSVKSVSYRVTLLGADSRDILVILFFVHRL